MLIRRIGIGLLALGVGAAGFVLLFVIGEGTNSGLLAYAAATLLFSLTAYGFSRVDFGGRIWYAVLMCAPVLLLSVGGADASGGLLALLMAAITLAAAILPPPPRARTGLSRQG